MKRYTLLKPLLLKPVLLGILCLSPLAQAQEDTERQYLTLLANEISALEAILHKAEVNKNKDARVQFQYEALRADLSQTRAAILRHVNAPRTAPRHIEPLQGDYRQ